MISIRCYYKSSYFCVFLVFRTFFQSSGFIFIRSSEFSLRDQLNIFILPFSRSSKFYRKRLIEQKLSRIECKYLSLPCWPSYMVIKANQTSSWSLIQLKDHIHANPLFCDIYNLIWIVNLQNILICSYLCLHLIPYHSQPAKRTRLIKSSIHSIWLSSRLFWRLSTIVKWMQIVR